MRARMFDHDEAYQRRQNGETRSEVAASYGVNPAAIRQLELRRDPVGHEALKAYHRDYQRRRLRKPCVNGCGRLAWHGPHTKGRCSECYRAEQIETADARDNHGTETRYVRGCRCSLCRAASAEARRRRRAADPEAARAYDGARKRKVRQAA